MKFGIIRPGRAIFDNDVIFAMRGRNKRRLDRALKRNGWQRMSGQMWQATEAAPHWHAPNAIPGRIVPNQSQKVWLLFDFWGHIKWIHWTPNRKKAQRIFRKQGYRLIG